MAKKLVVNAVKKSPNNFKAPTKQWRKWSETARAVFNRVYDFAIENPTLMLHPRAEVPKPAHWKTVAWNAAWVAADAVDGAIPTQVEDIDMRSGKTVRKYDVRSTLQ